jgi:hypothetical protein
LQGLEAFCAGIRDALIDRKRGAVVLRFRA